jgi:predicted small secreted protein
MKDRIMAFMALNGPSLGIVALIAAALFLLTGCNTIAGMGTDITKSAEWTKDKMSGSKDSSTTQTGAAK